MEAKSNNGKLTCVEAALLELDSALKYHRGPVAWGNTNLRANNYRDALQLACKHKRPVKFVKWYSIICLIFGAVMYI